ncbi:MAG: NAD(P)H-dependent oxidoreductase [Dissulfurispiraceae bacterium]
MKISVILAHPNKKSFNHAIAEAAKEALEQNGHQICFHDLYEEQFDPILTPQELQRECSLLPEITNHCEEISEAEGIIIIHPNWWGQPPAILKGWIDRVIRPGIAYEFLEDDKGEGVPKGLLKAQSAIVFNTSNTETEREAKVFGDPLESIWKKCVFDLCGVPVFHRKMFNIVVISSEEQRKEWLKEVRQTIENYYPSET